MDVAFLTVALRALHGGACSIELLPIGGSELAELEIVVISTWPSTQIGRRPPCLITKHGLMPAGAIDAAARVLGALYEHEKEISERLYKQTELPQA